VGYELVKSFAADNDNKIIAISRNALKLQQLKEECYKINSASNVFIYPFDLQSDGYNSLLLPFIKNELQSVDILVNNAGLLINKQFEHLTGADFDTVFSVNVKAVFLIIKTLIPLFPKGAHIVNISSMGGFQGSAKFSGLSLYSSSKGALGILTECLAEELKDKEIFVNALALGSVQTEMLNEAFPDYKAPVSAGQMALYIKDFALKGHQFFNGKILPVSISTP